MRANEFLTEAGLAKSDFYKANRLQVLITKIETGAPFLKTDKTSVVLKKDKNIIRNLKNELARGDNISKQNPAAVPLDFPDEKGNPVKLSSLQKTSEFGSSDKETIPVKPSNLTKLSGKGPATAEDLDDPEVVRQIISSKTFLASDLANRVISDPTLNRKAGKTGKIIVQLAKNITSGLPATLPAGLSANQIKAIRDYAGEYLGILQLLNGQSNFENKEAFFKHLGTNDLGTLNLYFPKLSSTTLTDSVAIKNMITGDMMKISSKGGKIGAPPSLDSLKIPQDIKDSKPNSKTIKFMDTARAAKGFNQPFLMLNELYSMNPSIINKMYEGLTNFLPFTNQDIENIVNVDEFNRRNIPPKVKHFLKLSASVESKGSNFGKIHYLLNKIVIDLVNNSKILPDLNTTVLEILGSNFIQIYSDVSKNQFTSMVKWPNKVDGTIQLYSKASASAPTHGKMSWYLS